MALKGVYLKLKVSTCVTNKSMLTNFQVRCIQDPILQLGNFKTAYNACVEVG
jgi:hypothetical protein